MAHKAVQSAYGDRVEMRGAFVPHDRFLPDRWSGVLEVRWKIDPAHPVVIGAGWFAREITAAGPEVVAEIARSGPERMPVLPGSSLKGAVRQVYELLTPSCRLERGRACRVSPRQTHPRTCPACSLFGAGGLGGRLAFGEARPEDDAWRDQLRVVHTPAAWRPRNAPPGTVRVYDLSKATDPVTGGTRKEEERTWSVAGDFRSRLRLVNASDEELGLLFASLGIGDEHARLRVGGKKYHGLGLVDVELVAARESHPERSEKAGAEAVAFAVRLVEAALQTTERRRTWEAIQRTAAVERPAT